MNDRNDLCARHSEQWRAFRKTFLDPCLAGGDEVQARFVKAMADTLRIAQESERRIVLFSENNNEESSFTVEWAE